MGVLSALEPKKVFQYFEEISQIPHGSGNIDAISNYLVSFAKERNLEVIQDAVKNVIIIKEATEGYEKEPALILQGHMDMVAVHKPDFPVDMKTTPLRIAVHNDRIYAEGTSLGGDDGIAVAYALAILDDDTLRHPRLEVVLTVDEEVGMDGARVLDVSMLQGKRLLNLDSEEEGIFLASCAGGARISCRLDLPLQSMEGRELVLTVGGLQGGHSGGEIHKERGNSNLLTGRALVRLQELSTIGWIEGRGGLADNAIPRETTVRLLIGEEEKEKAEGLLNALETEWKTELGSKDPNVFLHFTWGEVRRADVLCRENFVKAGDFLFALPNGVTAMSADMEGLVETSLNLGILKMENGRIRAEFAVRSSVESSKRALLSKVESVTRLAGGYCEISGDYPGWSYRKESPFRDKLVRIYQEMYQAEPKVEAIHAGLECGLLAGKIEDLDCISLGPNMYDIHTTEETLSISSTQRVWEFLIRVLAEKG